MPDLCDGADRPRAIGVAVSRVVLSAHPLIAKALAQAERMGQFDSCGLLLTRGMRQIASQGA
jgi:hypothetical protein